MVAHIPAGIPGARSLNGRLGFCRDLRDSDELSTVNCNEAVLQLCPTIANALAENACNGVTGWKRWGIHNLETREFTIKAKL